MGYRLLPLIKRYRSLCNVMFSLKKIMCTLGVLTIVFLFLMNNFIKIFMYLHTSKISFSHILWAKSTFSFSTFWTSILKYQYVYPGITSLLVILLNQMLSFHHTCTYNSTSRIVNYFLHVRVSLFWYSSSLISTFPSFDYWYQWYHKVVVCCLLCLYRFLLPALTINCFVIILSVQFWAFHLSQPWVTSTHGHFCEI